jgi:hypothetical protein
MYGMASLSSSNVIKALKQFGSDAHGLPATFHSDFDKKLMGGKTLKWLLTNNSRIISANAGPQSKNGFAEHTWHTMVQRAPAYITEKQVGHEFWFYSLLQAASMINQVPGQLARKLTSPFKLVHAIKPTSTDPILALQHANWKL